MTDGIAITIGNFEEIAKTNKPLSEKIKEFIVQSRDKFPSEKLGNIPLAVYILACIKHKSPLPSEFWRGIIFKNKSSENANDISAGSKIL
ncbi:MAG: hypothetical protein E3K36_15340 [Candidatus Brocadia sp.]|nr:hypothetical protein [Candidatus Brocadia sp.]